MRDPLYLGPTVVVSARVAALMSRPLRRLVAEARNGGERLDDEVLATVSAIDAAGRAYVSGRLLASSDDGMARRPLAELAPSSVVDGWLSTSDVADRLGCSERNVVRLIAARRLPSVRVGRAHLIDPAELARYLEDRSTLR